MNEKCSVGWRKPNSISKYSVLISHVGLLLIDTNQRQI